MKYLTDKELEHLEKLERAMSQGPWTENGYSAIHDESQAKIYRQLAKEIQLGKIKIHEEINKKLYLAEPLIVHVPASHGDTAQGIHVNNMRGIAEMRNAFPHLLTEIKELRSKLQSMEFGTTMFGRGD